MCPTTVAPSNMAAGGSIRPTLTRKVLVMGSACGSICRNSSSRCHVGVVDQGHSDLRVARSGTQQLSRHVERGVPLPLPGYSKDHLSGLHHLAGLSSPAYDGSRGVRLELCVAHLVFCNLQSGFGVFNLRLRGLDSRLGLVEQNFGRIFSRQERLFAREVILSFPQPSLRRHQSGLSGT